MINSHWIPDCYSLINTICHSPINTCMTFSDKPSVVWHDAHCGCGTNTNLHTVFACFKFSIRKLDEPWISVSVNNFNFFMLLLLSSTFMIFRCPSNTESQPSIYWLILDWLSRKGLLHPFSHSHTFCHYMGLMWNMAMWNWTMWNETPTVMSESHNCLKKLTQDTWHLDACDGFATQCAKTGHMITFAWYKRSMYQTVVDKQPTSCGSIKDKW